MQFQGTRKNMKFCARTILAHKGRPGWFLPTVSARFPCSRPVEFIKQCKIQLQLQELNIAFTISSTSIVLTLALTQVFLYLDIFLVFKPNQVTPGWLSDLYCRFRMPTEQSESKIIASPCNLYETSFNSSVIYPSIPLHF